MTREELIKDFIDRGKRYDRALIIHMYIRYGIRPKTKEEWDEANRKIFLLYSMSQCQYMALLFSPKGTKLVCTHEWRPNSYLPNSHKNDPAPKIGNVYTVSDSEADEEHHWKEFEELAGFHYTISCFDFAPGEMPSPEEAKVLYGDTLDADFEIANNWYQAVLAEEQQKRIGSPSSFTPNDLQNGDIIVFRCGEKGVCIATNDTVMLQYGGYLSYDEYDDNMEDPSDDEIHGWDIMTVSRHTNGFNIENGEYVYNRNKLK